MLNNEGIVPIRINTGFKKINLIKTIYLFLERTHVRIFSFNIFILLRILTF